VASAQRTGQTLSFPTFARKPATHQRRRGAGACRRRVGGVQDVLAAAPLERDPLELEPLEPLPMLGHLWLGLAVEPDPERGLAAPLDPR